MVGKLFFVALFCVAFAQEQDDVQGAIESGLYRLKGLRDSTERRIDGGIASVDQKKNTINSKTPAFINREAQLEQSLLRKLDQIAAELKGKVADKPSVLECIENARTTASENIKSLGPKFAEDMKRLQRTKLANIETASTPFPVIKKGVQTKYEKAETDIKNCKTSTCVRQVLTRVTREFDVLQAEMRRVLNNINIIFNNFQRDANTFYSNLSRQALAMQAFGLRKMRECVGTRDAMF